MSVICGDTPKRRDIDNEGCKEALNRMEKCIWPDGFWFWQVGWQVGCQTGGCLHLQQQHEDNDDALPLQCIVYNVYVAHFRTYLYKWYNTLSRLLTTHRTPIGTKLVKSAWRHLYIGASASISTQSVTNMSTRSTCNVTWRGTTHPEHISESANATERCWASSCRKLTCITCNVYSLHTRSRSHRKSTVGFPFSILTCCYF